MNIPKYEEHENLFAIRDKVHGDIHDSRFYCFEDAEFAINEIAYDFEVEEDQLEVVQLVRRK